MPADRSGSDAATKSWISVSSPCGAQKESWMVAPIHDPYGALMLAPKAAASYRLSRSRSCPRPAARASTSSGTIPPYGFSTTITSLTPA